MNDKTRRLTAEEVKFKALECREIAEHSTLDSHRIMLEHMAETWERIRRMSAFGGKADIVQGAFKYFLMDVTGPASAIHHVRKLGHASGVGCWPRNFRSPFPQPQEEM